MKDWSRLLDDKRNQGFDAVLVIDIDAPELLDHESFFHLHLESKAESYERKTDKAAQLAVDDGGTKKRQQQAGVNGVANQGVGASLN